MPSAGSCARTCQITEIPAMKGHEFPWSSINFHETPKIPIKPHMIKHVQKKNPRSRTFRITFGRDAGRRASFKVGCCISGIPERSTGLTDDDATTTTRDTKPASYALAPSVPRVRRVCDGHGGAVVLAVGRVAFVSCATPRGAGTSLNGSNAAAWWFVCRYL